MICLPEGEGNAEKAAEDADAETLADDLGPLLSGLLALACADDGAYLKRAQRCRTEHGKGSRSPVLHSLDRVVPNHLPRPECTPSCSHTSALQSTHSNRFHS